MEQRSIVSSWINGSKIKSLQQGAHDQPSDMKSWGKSEKEETNWNLRWALYGRQERKPKTNLPLCISPPHTIPHLLRFIVQPYLSSSRPSFHVFYLSASQCHLHPCLCILWDLSTHSNFSCFSCSAESSDCHLLSGALCVHACLHPLLLRISLRLLVLACFWISLWLCASLCHLLVHMPFLSILDSINLFQEPHFSKVLSSYIQVSGLGVTWGWDVLNAKKQKRNWVF